MDMEVGKHALRGEFLGNPNQSEGHHEYGIFMFCAGDPNRVKPDEYDYEERANDKLSKYLKLQ